jgi:hypothetical protein
MAAASPDAGAARDFRAGRVAGDAANRQTGSTSDDCANNATDRRSFKPAALIRLRRD